MICHFVEAVGLCMLFELDHFELIAPDSSKEPGQEKGEDLFQLWPCVGHGQAVRHSFQSC